MLAYEHLEGRGIRSADVLRAVREVPRAEFVPEAEKPFAFEDRPLNIGHCATISQPYMVAAMTELLDLEPHHKVLEIGYRLWLSVGGFVPVGARNLLA